jgi:hypothetical protein
MRRRGFARSLVGLFGLSGLAPVLSPAASVTRVRPVLLQSSPVAGFQYHEGEAVWALLSCGEALDLVREPANPYDEKAVRVEWRGRKLGYVPRGENHAVAQMMDRGETLSARVSSLQAGTNPWERIQFEVLLSADAWRSSGMAEDEQE